MFSHVIGFCLLINIHPNNQMHLDSICYSYSKAHSIQEVEVEVTGW